MNLVRITAAEATARIDTFDSIIDARSESEFALDHLPGAVNWPTLTDEQRQRVGTEFKQVSAFEARKQGAVLAARNIASHIEREASLLQRGWRPLVYCWRGGQRSGSLALVMAQIGFEVSVLEGGYRAFRKQVVEELEQLPEALRFDVLCGRTGSGKSRLLVALQAQGAQVLDLEALAHHRGSVLGAMPGGQPGQKAFETALWSALRRFSAQRPVFVESESRTIGRLRVPEALLSRMRASACVRVEMETAARIDLLMDDYPHHLIEVEALCERLQSLVEVRGAKVVDRWQVLARGAQWRLLVQELLEQHYDPIYLKSMARNFAAFSGAPQLTLKDGSVTSLQAAAATLLERQTR